MQHRDAMPSGKGLNTEAGTRPIPAAARRHDIHNGVRALKEYTMPAQVNNEECSGCGDCVANCPVDGVLVLQDAKAVVSSEECIECNACVDACPSNAMTMTD